MGDLISLGELTKPATVLIEKISAAVGVIFEPHRIRRKALAEADAENIRAVSQIKITDLNRRAATRWLEEEAHKQENIENITKKALPKLQADAKPQNIENDWIVNFFDKCRLISDDQMQNLWAKILSGESNKPGKYSKRTVNLLASMDKKDAELFTKLCSYCWIIGDEIYPIIYNIIDPIYHQSGIKNNVLIHLDDIGLIGFAYNGNIEMRFMEDSITAYYNKQCVKIHFPNPNHKTVRIGCSTLTKSGEDLYSICKHLTVDGFFEYVINAWRYPRHPDSFTIEVFPPQSNSLYSDLEVRTPDASV